jgi:hypothetical protein
VFNIKKANNMNSISSHTKIKDSDVNWKELESIGISRAELERNGDVERLLNGEPVSVLSLHLTLPGIEIEMDAILRIVEENSVPMLEISGIKPGQGN